MAGGFGQSKEIALDVHLRSAVFPFCLQSNRWSSCLPTLNIFHTRMPILAERIVKYASTCICNCCPVVESHRPCYAQMYLHHLLVVPNILYKKMQSM